MKRGNPSWNLSLRADHDMADKMHSHREEYISQKEIYRIQSENSRLRKEVKALKEAVRELSAVVDRVTFEKRHQASSGMLKLEDSS